MANYRPVSTPNELIEEAFKNLSEIPGFIARENQKQLALLLSDLISGRNRGAFEAPTGLGKSLAALVPAIAHAIADKKRIVIATYTNILAEQYWQKDLPLALSLFGDPGGVATLSNETSLVSANLGIKCQLLMGRQRYACLAAVEENAPDLTNLLMREARLGIETEFRKLVRLPQREMSNLWQKVATPPVCPGRLCPVYDDCFYYRARRRAEKAEIIITNHSVVIQDALMARDSDDGGGLLGKFDFLILDEAHDFPNAAINGLEFELSLPKLNALMGIGNRIETVIMPIANFNGETASWQKDCNNFVQSIERCQKDLVAYSLSLGRPGILTAAPDEVLEHPQVKLNKTPDDMRGAKSLAVKVSDLCDEFVKGLEDRIERWRDQDPERGKMVFESVRNYSNYLRQYGLGCYSLFDPQGVSVSYVGRSGQDTILRQDIIGLAEPLRELIWEPHAYACLSATLALDGNFDFFKRSTGVELDFEEVLPTPFDFASQAAIYLPPVDAIPDPTVARREGREVEYWHAMAAELSKIIRATEGRTLALFHSRKEMEGVLGFMSLPPELPIFVQFKSGANTIGEQFKKNVHSSLFALRSFWTGFDAPGETLSCVALVRVPFEVPIDPPQIARLAYLQTQGLDAFASHTLPLAKMLMRQGAGRLIRSAEDKGIVALLDPRLQTKRYGEEIIGNLPAEMRTFRDIHDAVGWIGLEASALPL